MTDDARIIPHLTALADEELAVARIRVRAEDRRSYRLARDLFLRGIGLVFLVAHASLWVQLHGLVGARGILPVADFLDRARAALGAAAYYRAPTLLWADASDAALHMLCATGVLLSIALVIGFFPAPVLAALWLVYLSLTVAGQVFLGFQWDGLLLECALTGLLLAPLTLRMRPAAVAPPRAGLFVMRLLLFKLMFLSGATKLLSGDPTWRDGTALEFHFETQPIPAATSWFAHHLPDGLLRAGVVGTIIVELLVPFLVFGPWPLRRAAALAFLLLQAGIAATGNFGFFNLLSVVLCVPLLDDALLARLPGARRALDDLADPAPRRRRRGPSACALGAAVLGTLSVFALLQELVRTARPDATPAAVAVMLQSADGVLLSWARPALLEPIAPFRSVNGYGLFRVMTTERPEIEIEALLDDGTWAPYAFRWKPGDPARRPRWAGPHMPRLDWQMWFAALQPRGAPWLDGLTRRLLDAEPGVLRLLASDPARGTPPRAVRLVFHRSRFATPDERRASGDWWSRELLGRSAPIVRRASDGPERP